jgi:hypothetical protein
MPSIPEILIIIVMLALPAAIAVAFIGRIGLPKWLGLLVLVPIGNLVLIIYLLSSAWPVNRELAMRRLEAGEGSEEDGWLAYASAVRAQKAGRLAEAERMYNAVIRRFPNASPGTDAQIGKSEMQKKA